MSNLILKYDFDGRSKLTIPQAVDHKLDGSDYDRGALEATQAGTRNCQEFLGELVEKLYDKGTLNKKDIEDLLGGMYTVIHE